MNTENNSVMGFSSSSTTTVPSVNMVDMTALKTALMTLEKEALYALVLEVKKARGFIESVESSAVSTETMSDGTRKFFTAKEGDRATLVMNSGEIGNYVVLSRIVIPGRKGSTTLKVAELDKKGNVTTETMEFSNKNPEHLNIIQSCTWVLRHIVPQTT